MRVGVTGGLSKRETIILGRKGYYAGEYSSRPSLGKEKGYFTEHFVFVVLVYRQRISTGDLVFLFCLFFSLFLVLLRPPSS